MRKTALLVIDVQNAMVLSEAPRLYARESVMGNIALLLSAARSAGAPVIFVQHEGRIGSGLARGSRGWAIAECAAPLPGEPVVSKKKCDAFFKTGLAEELQKAAAGRLVIAGMQTDYCVNATVRSAAVRGFEVTVASDAHTTFDNRHAGADQIVAQHNAAWASVAQLAAAREILF